MIGGIKNIVYEEPQARYQQHHYEEGNHHAGVDLASHGNGLFLFHLAEEKPWSGVWCPGVGAAQHEVGILQESSANDWRLRKYDL